MKSFVVAANWKMHKSPREAAEFFKTFLLKLNPAKVHLAKNEGAKGVQGSRPKTIVFFVPSVDLCVAEEALRKSEIAWGAQNCYFEMKGAFTGETSPQVLSELGARFTLVGHSERRAIFNESDLDTAKKVMVLQSVGITPMLCVGESLSEREANKTSEVIVRQLRAGLSRADLTKPLTIAYEPVWAIGTGKVATPAQANEAHLVLRKALTEIGGLANPGFAAETAILYGGSVKPDNAKEIASQPEVDGFLIGGASLEVDSFLTLCEV